MIAKRDTGRIGESDLTLPVLDLLSRMDDGFFETSSLIALLEIGLRPEGEDAQILLNRNDSKFSQIVRNMISHRASGRNLIAQGLATYDEKRSGLKITEEGRSYLIERLEDLPDAWKVHVPR